MIPNNAPGCFGSALAFKSDNAICRRCPFAPSCEPLHAENLILLRAKLGIKVRNSTHVKNKERGVDSLPKKTQELVNKIEALNVKIVSALESGVNPFPPSLNFMRIVAHLLIKLGFVDRNLLSMSFATKLNWAPVTAEAHARMAIQALIHIGVVDETEGKVQVRK